MNRIRKVYTARFRALLEQLHTRRVDQGLEWLLHRAPSLSRESGIPLTLAYDVIYERLREQVARARIAVTCEVSPEDSALAEPGRADAPFNRATGPDDSSLSLVAADAPDSEPASMRFVCDAGLGGLARWLRAAGYEAWWQPDIEDTALIQQARSRQAVLLTTDSLMMERRVLRDGLVPALWLAPSQSVTDQLARVFFEFRLGRRHPRCMPCGGELREVDKQSVAGRIPPRTYRWLDEYYQCASCHQLFWHGTHWQRIHTQLNQLAPAHETDRNCGCG